MQPRQIPTLAQLLQIVEQQTSASTLQRPPGVVVVIAQSDEQLTQLRCDDAGLRPDTVRTIIGQQASLVHEALIALPPIALVIDTRSAAGPQQRKLFESAYFLLDTGARWAALLGAGAQKSDDEVAPTGAGIARVQGDPQPLMARLGEMFLGAEGPEDVRARWRTHHRSTEHAVLTPELTAFVKGRSHLLKIRDADALEVLPRREPDLGVREVAGRAAVSLTTHNHVQYGVQLGEPQLPAVLESPRLSLRRYDGLVTLPVSGLAYHGRTLLPDSFRWHLSEVPTSSGIRDTGQSFARLQPHAEPQHLTGSYFHFGYNNPGHFGHLMTEALAKLWGWDAAKADDPSLKILCRLHPDRPTLPADRLESRLLPAYGIAPEDIVWADGPVSVDTLYANTPMWHNTVPFHAHDGMLAEWVRLGDGLLRGADVTPGPERVFVTRRAGNRPCRNAEEVEAIFEEMGYTVALTGHLSIPEQVALFANARVVAGFGGAGMFNLAYARKVESVVVLNQWAYEARNEQLFAAVHRAACHTFWSAPSIDRPAQGSTYAAHQSGWEFDLGLSDQLRAVLAGL
ncbi:MAG: glycosyltransferase family 61 protein [Nocardioides sp.]